MQNEQHIWQYLDGEGNGPERAALQQHLTANAALKVELESRQNLHHALQQIEVEQPSLRFVMNVMDNLPILYKKAIEPLISSTWIKVFLGSLIIFVVGIFGYAVTFVSSTSSNDAAENAFIVQLNALPMSIFTTLAMISFSYLFFVILDRQLNKRFSKE